MRRRISSKRWQDKFSKKARDSKPSFAAEQPAKKQFEKKILIPKTKAQSLYIQSIKRNDITFCKGPAGSGKTAIAVAIACEYLLSGRIEKLVITRPVIESGKGLGFLPGTMHDKVNPYMVPILEEMQQYLGRELVSQYKESNIIEICPLEYMRGRNFHNTFMILDEGQNCTFEQIKMFVTRIGINSIAVINGDTNQSDLPEYTKGGLDNFIKKLDDLDGIGVCQLSKADIQRNSLIARILERIE
jgi:phosphate starvation-inducible PhoH-like protein